MLMKLYVKASTTKVLNQNLHQKFLLMFLVGFSVGQRSNNLLQ